MEAIAFFTVSGNLASNPEPIKGGCRLTVMANTEYRRDNGDEIKKTHAFKITVFGKLADTLMQYAEKGAACTVYNGVLTTSQRPVRRLDDNGQEKEEKWLMNDLLAGPGTQIRFQNRSGSRSDESRAPANDDATAHAEAASSRGSKGRNKAPAQHTPEDDIPF